MPNSLELICTLMRFGIFFVALIWAGIPISKGNIDGWRIAGFVEDFLQWRGVSEGFYE